VSKVKEAVKFQMDKIAKCQQYIKAFYEISFALERNHRNRLDETLHNAINKIHACLHRDLSEAWDSLSWLAPVDQDAFDYLKQRTKTWFQTENREIMSFLGQEGAYSVRDEEEFRKELLALFGCTKEEKE